MLSKCKEKIVNKNKNPNRSRIQNSPDVAPPKLKVQCKKRQQTDKMVNTNAKDERIPVVNFRRRKLFHSARMDPNESVTDWYHRIKTLAKPCRFGNHLNALIFDKFVIGLNDSLFEELCVSDEELSFDEAVDLALKIEAKDSDVTADVIDDVSTLPSDEARGIKSEVTTEETSPQQVGSEGFFLFPLF